MVFGVDSIFDQNEHEGYAIDEKSDVPSNSQM